MPRSSLRNRLAPGRVFEGVPRASSDSVGARLARQNWESVRRDLDARGHARLPGLLTPDECARLARLFGRDPLFRSTVEMERLRFGVGRYRYFARPLPRLVEELRARAYSRLAPIANDWAAALREDRRFPAGLETFLRECRRAGQTKPTPLLLRYQAGGYNCLHRDLYGEVAFPLQLAVFLSRPGFDYEGGAFLLVEQRPRQQSRAEALFPAQGEGVIFPSAARPVPGSRGFYRASVRHGVSTVSRGERSTLGIVFHDAR